MFYLSLIKRVLIHRWKSLAVSLFYLIILPNNCSFSARFMTSEAAEELTVINISQGKGRSSLTQLKLGLYFYLA
jgi:hypothetical protein